MKAGWIFMQRAACIAYVLVAVSFAHGQDMPVSVEADEQEVTIQGDLEVDSREPIILEIDYNPNGLATTYKWLILGDNRDSLKFVMLDAGKRFHGWALQDGEFEIFVIIVSSDVDNHVVKFAKAELKVGDGGPGPDPDPDPDPDPVVIPDDPYGNVGQVSYNVASKFKDAARTAIAPTAKLYREIGKKWANAEFPSYSAARSVLGVERKKIWENAPDFEEKWLAAISVNWEEHIDVQESDRDDIIEFWNALAVGLEAVK